MADEIMEAIQIIRLAYEGVDISLKLGGGTLKTAKDVVSFFVGMIDHEKLTGKTSMKKLLMRGGDLQVFQIEKEDLKKVEKMSKKYGILYSQLPEIGKGDGKIEMVIHSEAVPRVNLIIEKLGKGKLESFDDYIKENEGGNFSKLVDFFNKQKGKGRVHADAETDKAIDNLIEKVGTFIGDKKVVSVDEVKKNFGISDTKAESVMEKLSIMGALEIRPDGTYEVLMDQDAMLNRIKSYKEIADRIKYQSKANNLNVADITISDTLAVKETDKAIKTRVPGTWGDSIRFIWIDKDDIIKIHSGKTFLTFIDKEKEYELVDAKNNVVEKKKGDDLYSHYSAVNENVRSKAEKEKLEKEKQKRKAAAKIKKEQAEASRKR